MRVVVLKVPFIFGLGVKSWKKKLIQHVSIWSLIWLAGLRLSHQRYLLQVCVSNLTWFPARFIIHTTHSDGNHCYCPHLCFFTDYHHFTYRPFQISCSIAPLFGLPSFPSRRQFVPHRRERPILPSQLHRGDFPYPWIALGRIKQGRCDFDIGLGPSLDNGE